MEHPLIRITPFVAVFFIMAIWEWLSPRRSRPVPRINRWPANLSITLLNTLILRLLFPAAAIGAAVFAKTHQLGLFNLIDLPPLPIFILSVILLDLAIYIQHVLVHKVPLLWRIHRMHHSDIDLDVTSGLRFHPIEIVFSMLVKYAVILLLGVPPEAVLLFEIILNASAMFNHSNAFIPDGIESKLRWFVVTPDMHRVHHSVVQKETDSNYGFFLPWWDRLFGTYKESPTPNQLEMTIGLPIFRKRSQQKLIGLLAQPFLKASQ